SGTATGQSCGPRTSTSAPDALASQVVLPGNGGNVRRPEGRKLDMPRASPPSPGVTGFLLLLREAIQPVQRKTGISCHTWSIYQHSPRSGGHPGSLIHVCLAKQTAPAVQKVGSFGPTSLPLFAPPLHPGCIRAESERESLRDGR